MRNLTKIFSIFTLFSLLLGIIFLPLTTQASIFSSFFSDEALADVSTNSDQSTDVQKNSQIMSLLQANISSDSILQDRTEKNNPKDKKKLKENKELALNTEAEINIVSGNAIMPTTGPLGVSDDKDVLDSSSQDTSIYVVRKGDTISQIADLFDVSVNTILAANDLKKGDKLTEGQVLLILPISGIEHIVLKSQNLKGIAKIYKVDASDIALYNGLALEDKLVVGDKILIPGGDEMSDEGGDKPAPNLSSSVARDQNYYITHPLQNLLGYFVNPAPTGHKTQGLHGPGHRGIDIGLPTGSSLYASATGKVLITKSSCRVGQKRCGGGYGNMVILQHSNGAKTLYAHMSKVTVRSGDEVVQGGILGYSGNTGRSTGPHLHFEVFGAKNPGADWSWAN